MSNNAGSARKSETKKRAFRAEFGVLFLLLLLLLLLVMLASKLFGEDLGRWVVLVIGCIVASSGGTLYTFGGYSVQLGQAIDHSDVDFFGSCGDFGLYLGFLFGLWFDKQGPTPPMIVGSLFTFFGYFGVFLQASGRVEPMIWSFYILYFLIGQGSYSFFICAYSTNIRNFPAVNSGSITALFVFCFSLPSVICTLIYNHLLNQNVESYLMLFTIYCAISGLLGIFLLTRIPLKTITPNRTNDIETIHDTNDTNDDPQEIVSLHPENIIQVSVWKSFTYLDMWLVFWAFFGTSGAGLMWKNSIGSIATSFGMADRIGGLLITWGLLSAFSRLLFGGLADYYGAKIPRPFWGLLTAAICFIPHFWFLFTSGNYILWLITVGTGIGYGTCFCICNSLAIIYYSSQDAGLKIGLLALAPAFGGTAATYLAGVLSKQRAPDGDVTLCTKEDNCFEYAFLLSSGLLLMSMIFSVFLCIRHYQRIQRKSQSLLIQGDEISSA